MRPLPQMSGGRFAARSPPPSQKAPHDRRLPERISRRPRQAHDCGPDRGRRPRRHRRPGAAAGDGGPDDPARGARPALGRAGGGLRQDPDRAAGKPLSARHGPDRQRRTRGDRPGAANHRPARPLPRLQPREPRHRALRRGRAGAAKGQAQCSGRATLRRAAGEPFRAMTDATAEAASDPSHRSPRPSWRPGQPIKRIGDLLALGLDHRARVLDEMSPLECAQIFYDWTFWARPDQAPPPGDWIVWLILAGRGAGKTRAGAEAVRLWSQSFPNVNLIGPTADDVRDVMVLGESGILNCCRKDERPRYLASAAKLEWPNGAMSLLFSAEEPDRLRGKPHMVVTTTPRPTRIIKQLAADKDTIVTRGSTFQNKGHLARAFLERIARRYEGRVIGRQELLAEIVEETLGALWTRALIERQRVAPEAAPREFAEVVVAVDPPARSGSRADECGLIVAGKASDGRLYVLADLTSQGDSPAAWAARVGAAYRGFRANRVVAEINNGGDMVAEVLRQAEPHLPVRTVTATRGKFLRAEPVAAAYERGLVFHAGGFPQLEDQLCALTPDFDRRGGPSPDRADALVWAIADLLALDRPSSTGMIDFWAGR